MPPRWPRKPDRNDPSYRQLDDRMNFAVHVATFAAINSGLWFVRNLYPETLPWLKGFTWGWLAILGLHAVLIFAILNYNPPTPRDKSSNSTS